MTAVAYATSIVRGELRRDRWRVIGAALSIAVSGAIIAIGPSVMRYGFDSGIRDGDRGALRLAVGLGAALLVAGGLIGGVRTLLMSNIGQGLLHELRCRAMAGMLRLDLAVYESARRGDLQARITSDVESLSNAAENLMPNVAGHVIAVVGGLIAVGVLAPPLLVVALISLPPALIAGRWLLRRSRVVYPALLARNGVAVGRLTETVEGASTITALHATERQMDRLRAVDRELVDANVDAATMRNWFYSALLIVQSVGTAAVVVGAGLLVDSGRASVGVAAAAILALAGVYGPLSLLIGQLDDILAARAALQRVVELADSPDVNAFGESLPARGTLRFDNVTYRYPSENDATSQRPALAGFSMSVSSGEHVALAGMTGSGKSTIGRLAVGLAAPSAGRVSFDGVDLRTASDADPRRHLLLIPQETFLVSGSIADNARIAVAELDDAAVERAVDELGLRAWIDALPDGIGTDVGPSGGHLSAGERQLVTLLRVAVADPAVIVLDEATSMLDPATESRVAAALTRLGAGRTVLIIAHRPQTAARCDRIAVLHEGRMVDIGTHAELLARSDAYNQLWTA